MLLHGYFAEMPRKLWLFEHGGRFRWLEVCFSHQQNEPSNLNNGIIDSFRIRYGVCI